MRVPWNSLRAAAARPFFTLGVLLVKGQITPAEAARLALLAQRVPAERVIVEVGSYRGRSTVALAKGSHAGAGVRVYAVDPHVEFRGLRGGRFGPPDQAALYRSLSRARVGETAAVVSLPSLQAASSWRQRDIGLLFLDGDHSYDAVKADFEAWRPWLVDDAVVAFHDCDTEGVRRLLDELEAAGTLTGGGEIDLLAWRHLA